MKYFRADLHVHSRFSRATSGRLNIRNLAAWSMIKGLSVMSTGDFTHPAWRDELRRDLVYDDNSGSTASAKRRRWKRKSWLFPSGRCQRAAVPHPSGNQLHLQERRFRTQSAQRPDHAQSGECGQAVQKLAAIGNITSDGRPILGLVASISLKWRSRRARRAHSAHIWTPWFSLFGSKSGFDALEDCFGSLSSHIFALETGLSSDPDMNRLWSALDRYALVSIPTRIPGKPRREANLFEGTPSHDGIFDALRRAARDEEGSGCIYRGTVSSSLRKESTLTAPRLQCCP
ncbi:MAG: hypothetical protein ACLT2T_00430 [Bilophila wadsworthia]